MLSKTRGKLKRDVPRPPLGISSAALGMLEGEGVGGLKITSKCDMLTGM